jgi:hypothetical protein
MGSGLPIPFFPSPPREYNQPYFAQLIRNFAVFAEQSRAPGPIRGTSLTLTTEPGNIEEGLLSWNTVEETVDLTMGQGVTQQIGFETYMRCENDTGSTIPNGTVVGFSGVNSEIEVAPYIADGSVPELYFVGVTTFEMEDQVVGPVTVFGKVRGLNTSAWAAGDILYASPTTAGALTNVRPTAPDAVIVVAAVIVSDATDGEIMVRPTIPIGLDYGTFSSNADQTLAATNTAKAVSFTTTQLSNGVTLSGSPATQLVVADAGFYQIAVSLQLTSSSASAKNIFVWLAKNGSAIANTTRVVTLSDNSAYFPFSTTYDISLVISDYVEIMWAADSTDVSLDAVAASGFAPAAPSVIVIVTQIQL